MIDVASADVTVYPVEGMTCDGCVRSLSAALRNAAPALRFEVSLDRNAVLVRGEHEPGVVRGAVDDAGFDNG